MRRCPWIKRFDLQRDRLADQPSRSINDTHIQASWGAPLIVASNHRVGVFALFLCCWRGVFDEKCINHQRLGERLPFRKGGWRWGHAQPRYHRFSASREHPIEITSRTTLQIAQSSFTISSPVNVGPRMSRVTMLSLRTSRGNIFRETARKYRPDNRFPSALETGRKFTTPDRAKESYYGSGAI